jgi:superfamily I DNA/RNA helicase
MQLLDEMVAGTRRSTGFSTILSSFRNIQGQLTNLRSRTGTALLEAWLTDDAQCAELRELAQNVIDETPDCDAKKLSETVLELITEPEIPDVVSEVRIMSLHKSKGLSANVVIIAGCVEGLIPRKQDEDLSDAAQDEQIEESRRLLFVGLTRVKASPHEGSPGHLLMSASRNVPTGIAKRSGIAIAGQARGVSRTIASRFLSELGPDCPAPQTPIA